MADPNIVELCEVGPRDGLQFESTRVPTARKVAWIARLARAGLPRIQAVSFVHPTWVPQMADAEAVLEALPEVGGTVYTGLVLNRRGLERARQTRLTHVDLSIATNEQHSRDNANMTVEEGVAQAEQMLEEAARCGLQAQIGLQTVWGYAAPGDTPLDQIAALAERFAPYAPESISLADSTGLANPNAIRERVRAVGDAAPGVPIVLHLHDTRGLGLANVVAALGEGVRRFDTSHGGMGGCPFIPGATGNIATEDTVYLVESLGYATGIDRNAVAEVSREIEAALGKRFSGKMHRLDPTPSTA